MDEPRDETERREPPAPPEDEPSLVRHEEEVAGVDTRWGGIGYVRARKRVDTVRVRESIPREVEDVELMRVPVEAEDSGKVETLEDGSISIPVYEERLVVSKQTVLKERVIIRKRTVTRQERVRAQLKRERVSVEADEGIELLGAEELAAARPSALAAMPGRGIETRPFFLTSEFLGIALLVLGLAIAGLSGALEGTLAWVLITAAVAGYLLARGFAKSRVQAHGWELGAGRMRANGGGNG